MARSIDKSCFTRMTDVRVVMGSLAILLLALICYLFVDFKLANYVAEHGAGMKDLFKAISLAGDSVWYLVPALVIGLVYIRSKPKLSMKAWFVFASVAVSGIIANIIKFILGRPRPGMYLSEGLTNFQFFETASKFASMPSGHATTVFSLAVLVAYQYPKLRWPAYLFAVIVAVSRIMVNKHYLSDVILGSLLGAYTTFALYHCYYRHKIYE